MRGISPFAAGSAFGTVTDIGTVIERQMMSEIILAKQIDPQDIFEKLVEAAGKFAPRIFKLWTAALWTSYLYVFFNDYGFDHGFKVKSGRRYGVLLDQYWLEGSECKLVLEVENTYSKLKDKIDLLIKCKTQLRVLIGCTGVNTPENIKEKRGYLIKELQKKLLKKPIVGKFLLIFIDTACPHLKKDAKNCPRDQDCIIEFKGYAINSDGSTIQLESERINCVLDEARSKNRLQD